MSSVRSGPKNAEWVKQRDTSHDISCGTADFKSGANYDEKKTQETGIDVEDIIGDEAVKDIDAEKSTKDKVWDQTKEICGAVKNGVQAGWSKVAGE